MLTGIHANVLNRKLFIILGKMNCIRKELKYILLFNRLENAIGLKGGKTKKIERQNAQQK